MIHALRPPSRALAALFTLSATLSVTLGASQHLNAEPTQPTQPTQEAQQEVAPTLEALNTPTLPSGLYLARFDRSVRPQDDLYRFVNGRWLTHFELPADKSRYGVFNDLHERAREQLKAIIMGLSQEAELSAEGQKVRDAYSAFMNTEAVEAAGLTPIQTHLKEIDALKSVEALTQAFGERWALGLTRPLSGWVDQDAKAPNEYRLYFVQSGLGLPDRDYYLKEDDKFKTLRADYIAYLTSLFKEAGEAEPEAQAKAAYELELALAKAQWTRAESRDRTKAYNPFTVRELQAQWPALPWASFFAGLGATPERVIIRQPSFVTALSGLLTDERLPAWKSYLKAHLISDRAPYMNATLEGLHFNFYGVKVSGKEANEPRWKRAISFVEELLGEALGKEYVKRHFKPEAKARMETLVANLLATFKERIEGLEWMSPETKARAQAKLARFSVKIGYPNEWRDYSALEVSAQHLIKTLEAARRFEHEREMRKLGAPINREEWFMPPQMVNAYYNPSMNEIVFPAAILQPPFFNLEADDAVNYGGIGAVIGHEVSHGFDDQGRKSDGEGFLRDWWSAEDAERFQSRAGALVTHYAEYEPVEGMKINGELTLGENIGDLGGLTVALSAYQRSLKGKEAPVLDGFTGAQRVFLSWAQVWACKYRDQELRRRVLTDPHSPAPYRVKGIVRQLDAFYDAFKLTPQDALYLPPEARVKIW